MLNYIKGNFSQSYIYPIKKMKRIRNEIRAIQYYCECYLSGIKEILELFLTRFPTYIYQATTFPSP